MFTTRIKKGVQPGFFSEVYPHPTPPLRKFQNLVLEMPLPALSPEHFPEIKRLRHSVCSSQIPARNRSDFIHTILYAYGLSQHLQSMPSGLRLSEQCGRDMQKGR